MADLLRVEAADPRGGGDDRRPRQESSELTGARPAEEGSSLVDAKIREVGGWRGEKLARLRATIRNADPLVVEEMKWKKPSNPTGVPVWSHDGIVCIGEALKNAVRLTFPKGASVADPTSLFNARLDSNSVRAVDFREEDAVDEGALKAMILEAVRLNASKARQR